MKKIEERKEIALNISQGLLVEAHDWEARNTPILIWGDEFPIVRLGSEVGFVDEEGDVFPSIEAAFVSRGGCNCLATTSIKQAVNRIAEFLALIAMGAKPSEIAKLIFHGEIFMFETFSDSMEQRGLVKHTDGDPVEGYQPLDLTFQGERGLRMCLGSDMVELPSRIHQATVQLLEEPEPVLALQAPVEHLFVPRFSKKAIKVGRRSVARKQPALV